MIIDYLIWPIANILTPIDPRSMKKWNEEINDGTIIVACMGGREVDDVSEMCRSISLPATFEELTSNGIFLTLRPS